MDRANQNHWIILSVLTVLMLLTRSSHTISLAVLPNASWAIFFIAGFYLRRAGWFIFFLAQAFALDLIAVTWGGVSNFCVSPAYPFLVPAYAALWLSGLWYASHYTMAWSNLPLLLLSVLSGALVCELLSSGGFYFVSGRFTDTSLSGFAERLALYFPLSLGALLFYTIIAALLHLAITLTRHKTSDSGTVKGQ